MNKFENNTTINFLENLASTCDPRDQKWHDIQQAKLGLSPARPLLEEYKCGLDPRDQEHHDLNMHLNRFDIRSLEPRFPKFDPVDVHSVFSKTSTDFGLSQNSTFNSTPAFDPIPKKFIP